VFSVSIDVKSLKNKKPKKKSKIGVHFVDFITNQKSLLRQTIPFLLNDLVAWHQIHETIHRQN
jgi:hypothetical protein